MKKSLLALTAALPLLLTAGPAVATEFGYDEAERQQELLGVWFGIRERNAQRGDRDAQFDVGMAHYTARGTEQDDAAAAEWFAQAAEQGHARAHYFLGYLHATGRGVPVDAEKSGEHYRRAAELGDMNAQYHLGRDLLADESADPAEAAEWIERAAGQGLASAQYHWGYLLETGRGVERSVDDAVEWYVLAAEQGNAQAQRGLGRLHMAGRGVNRDRVQAWVWYSLGDDGEHVERLESRMSEAELAAARESLAEQRTAMRTEAAVR
ncbi:tetratricopeptide repeat protein [Thioalkalivibrio sp. ALE19]|uniref:tetratricopeptide repeat protein n=1 Tax=Thioalkalivibrio sp. ALE19 TaxID=1266909 RepID=UPI0004182139|nr:tetratricopeptide repeat protein [Thioalkalivibrio sp. ALE19]